MQDIMGKANVRLLVGCIAFSAFLVMTIWEDDRPTPVFEDECVRTCAAEGKRAELTLAQPASGRILSPKYYCSCR